jgi:hypothetical protein
MTKEPHNIFSISNSDTDSVQEGLKAFDFGRVLTASVDELARMHTGKIRASFKKDRTYSVIVGY